MKKIATNLENFIKEINTIIGNGDVTVMDAVVHYCDINNIEIEAVASIIKSSPKMKAKLQAEAEDLNYLPKRARIPGL